MKDFEVVSVNIGPLPNPWEGTGVFPLTVSPYEWYPIRIDARLFAAVQSIADRDKRSFSEEVERILNQYLAQQEKPSNG